MNEMTARAAALGGLVLVVISIWLDAVGGQSYWDDGTQGVFMLILALGAGLLLAMSWMQNRAEPARTAAALSFLLLGYTTWIIAVTAFGNWGEIDAGGWLAWIGSIVAALGAWVGSQSMGTRPLMASAMGMRGVQMGALAALGGVVLCVISIWLEASSNAGLSYWDLSDDKILGIVMLVAAGLTGAALFGAWSGRGQGAALWASAFATLLWGLFLLGPVTAAFGDFGSLGAGGWLGFFGGLIAVGGTCLAHASTAEARMASPAPAV